VIKLITITVDVAAPVEGKANKHWWIVFSIALTAFLWGIAVFIHCIYRNGTWGLNKTVGWAWDITLRLVGWYWSCWNFNFCGIIIPSAMENGN
jgi:hypothetical protein